MTALVFLDTETVTLEPGHDVIWEIAAVFRDNQRPDYEWRWQLRPNLDKAHPDALKISCFHERFVVPDGIQAIGWSPINQDGEPAQMTYRAVAGCLAGLIALPGARHIVGAVPNFDTERISAFLRRELLDDLGAAQEWRDPWHYHLIDVENLAVGHIAGAISAGKTMNAIAAEHGLTGEPVAELATAMQSWTDLVTPPWSSDDLSRALGVEPPGDDQRHTALGDARWCRDLYDAITGARA